MDAGDSVEEFVKTYDHGTQVMYRVTESGEGTYRGRWFLRDGQDGTFEMRVVQASETPILDITPGVAP